MADTASTPAQREPFANLQNEIYLRGLAGERPEHALLYEQLEAAARKRLSAEAFGYVAGGAGRERTMAANLAAFERVRIVPRMLRDVSARDVSANVLGTAMPAPLLLAPIGVQSIVDADGELATARAAARVGLPLIASTAASHTLEEIAKEMGEASRWFQLYWPTDRELAASFIARAQRAGYGAIVVTLDTWLLGWRPRDLQGAYLPFLKGEGVANYFADPVFCAGLERSPGEDPGMAIARWSYEFANPRVTWEDLGWLRERTELPIVLKGIQHPADASLALEAGVQGLIVSNHGGRQVDGAIGALEALRGVRDVVGEGFPVLFDSGVRSGADIFKALALGADAVCVGRPYMWGLALGGAAGVEQVLRHLLAEFDLTLALSGLSSLAQITPGALAPEAQ